MNIYDEVEQVIQSKNHVAPRSTPELLEDLVADIQYVLLPDRRSTLCCISLVNGFTVHGISSVVSAENYDQEVGRITSYKKAHQALKDTYGFLIAERRYQEKQAKCLEALQGKGEYFEHYTGGIYKLLHIAVTELELESTAVYQSVTDGIIYTRPAGEFYEKFKRVLDMDAPKRDYVDLQIEYDEVARRVHHLEVRLGQGKPDNVDENQWLLLKCSLAPMREYHGVLMARMIDMDLRKKATQ